MKKIIQSNVPCDYCAKKPEDEDYCPYAKLSGSCFKGKKVEVVDENRDRDCGSTNTYEG